MVGMMKLLMNLISFPGKKKEGLMQYLRYQEKHELSERMFRRNMEQYDKYCDDYEENENTETLNNIEKYEDRLKYFI